MYKEMISKIFENVAVDDTDAVCRRINILKDTGIIADDIRVEIKDRYVEYAGVLLDKKEKLTDILNNLIKYSTLPAKDDELCRMRETIKVGAEFSFHKENCNFSMRDLEDQYGGEHVNEIKAADEKIKSWTNNILSLRGNDVKGVHVHEVRTLTAKKKYENLNIYEAVKLQLTLSSFGHAEETWWINFDLDPMCIEIQTEPKTYAFYDTYQYFIKEVVFSDGEWKPVKDPQIGGGGHINLDYASAFLDTPYYFKNFLVLYANNVAKGISPKLIESEDEDNAPFLHEVGELKEFADVMRDFNNMSQGDAAETKLADSINQYVYKKMTNVLRGMGVKDSEAKHYQAVNLEHLNPLDPTEKRVEMRRFDAQEDIGEFLKELDALYDLIQDGRIPLKLNINYRSWDVVMD